MSLGAGAAVVWVLLLAAPRLLLEFVAAAAEPHVVAVREARIDEAKTSQRNFVFFPNQVG